MQHIKAAAAATVLSLAVVAPSASAQVLHLNDRWDECAIVIDPALSQSSWNQFVREVGLVTYFRPLSSAKPLGPMNFEVSVLNWGTMIDDADDAWNDTFSHPDSEHTLFDGNALLIPGLMFRIGLTDRMDAGAYFTKGPSSNYGFLGGQLQYNFLSDEEQNLDVSGRISAVRLYGPEDMNASTYGLDFVVSKEFSRVSPYVGVSGYLARGQETTTAVNLEDVTATGVQGMVGVAVSLASLKIGAEFNMARVPGYSFKIAFGS